MKVTASISRYDFVTTSRPIDRIPWRHQLKGTEKSFRQSIRRQAYVISDSGTLFGNDTINSVISHDPERVRLGATGSSKSGDFERAKTEVWRALGDDLRTLVLVQNQADWVFGAVQDLRF